MKLYLFATAIVTIGLSSCTNKNASFKSFSYTGHDMFYETPIDSTSQYFNPILSGFYPDPSICRKDSTFYMVCSSFSYFPGIPIFKSADLVHWQQIGHVLDRAEQLNLDNIRLSGGIYAPDIQYNKHNNTFYLITTLCDGGGNFIVKTQDPEQGWSNPIWIPSVGGIDPSLFFDNDGSAYIVNNDTPQEAAEYDGHRAIWMRKFNTETDSTEGEPWVVINGGIDRSQKPIWIEGPHVYNINGKYFLMAAEGGTSINHSEVILSSDRPEGPYTPCAYNPILTQRDLPDYRMLKVTCTGHADLVQDIDSTYWAIFLGCRPYQNEFYNTGRETFLLPVSFDESGSPIILPKGEQMPIIGKKNNLKQDNSTEKFSGNFAWTADFSKEKLSDRFIFIRTPRSKWYTLKDNKLELEPRAISIDSTSNPSFIGFRQQHQCFVVKSELQFTPNGEHDFAGLVCHQNEKHYIALGKTIVNGKQAIVVEKRDGDTKSVVGMFLIDESDYDETITLEIEGDGANYSFGTIINSKRYHISTIDATLLSTEKAGGFVGTVIGLYSTSARLTD